MYQGWSVPPSTVVQVTFDPTEYTVNENAGTVTLIVRKIGQSAIPVAVNISTSSGSATGMCIITGVELPHGCSSLPPPSHFPHPLLPLSLFLSFILFPSLPSPLPLSPSLMCPAPPPFLYRWNRFHGNSTANLDLPSWWR